MAIDGNSKQKTLCIVLDLRINPVGMKAAQTTTFGVVEREDDYFPGVETIKLLRRIISTPRLQTNYPFRIKNKTPCFYFFYVYDQCDNM